jgi:hypothetical protein
MLFVFGTTCWAGDPVLPGNAGKGLTLSGLRGKQGLKMTIVCNPEGFSVLFCVPEVVCSSAMQTLCDLFWPSVLRGNSSGPKTVQKIFKKIVDTKAEI